MRVTTGILLAVLISPWAQAELIDDVNDRGELRIAVQGDTPPYTFKQNEQLTGFSVELGQALASELDVRVEIIETPADEVLTGVESGKYDIALEPSKAGQQTDARLDVIESPSQGTKPSVLIPFQKDNPAFQSAVENALKRIKDDGRMAALEQKWLAEQVPATAAQ